MEYNKISHADKHIQLQKHLKDAIAQSEATDILHQPPPNWRDRPQSISQGHRPDIDTLYCQLVLIPKWDQEKQSFVPVLLPEEMPNNEALFMPFLRHLSFGSIEIETNLLKTDFDRVIDQEKLPRNMKRQTFHEAINTFFTHQWLWQTIIERKETIQISEQSIKYLHTHLMRGLSDHAGCYSRLSKDTPEAMNRWINTTSKAATLDKIAKAHVAFMSIHPFDSGNERVGRALLMAQCLNAQLMPPIFDHENRAMYYTAIEHAMMHDRYHPLIRLFDQAALRSKQIKLETNTPKCKAFLTALIRHR